MSTVTLVNSSPQINTQPLSDSEKLKLKFNALVALTSFYEQHFEKIRNQNGRNYETIKSGVCLTPGEWKISIENIEMMKKQMNDSDYATQKKVYEQYRLMLFRALSQREPASLASISIPTIPNIEAFSPSDLFEISSVLNQAKNNSFRKYGFTV